METTHQRLVLYSALGTVNVKATSVLNFKLILAYDSERQHLTLQNLLTNHISSRVAYCTLNSLDFNEYSTRYTITRCTARNTVEFDERANYYKLMSTAYVHIIIYVSVTIRSYRTSFSASELSCDFE
jgi:hypothetical protein